MATVCKQKAASNHNCSLAGTQYAQEQEFRIGELHQLLQAEA